MAWFKSRSGLRTDQKVALVLGCLTLTTTVAEVVAQQVREDAKDDARKKEKALPPPAPPPLPPPTIVNHYHYDNTPPTQPQLPQLPPNMTHSRLSNAVERLKIQLEMLQQNVSDITEELEQLGVKPKPKTETRTEPTATLRTNLEIVQRAEYSMRPTYSEDITKIGTNLDDDDDDDDLPSAKSEKKLQVVSEVGRLRFDSHNVYTIRLTRRDLKTLMSDEEEAKKVPSCIANEDCLKGEPSYDKYESILGLGEKYGINLHPFLARRLTATDLSQYIRYLTCVLKWRTGKNSIVGEVPATHYETHRIFEVLEGGIEDSDIDLIELYVFLYKYCNKIVEKHCVRKIFDDAGLTDECRQIQRGIIINHRYD